jgi:Holliday junction DNA helicase RuvB
MARERIVTSDEVSEDQLDPQSHTLRPRALDQYIGQSALVERIRIALDASRARDQQIPNVLLEINPGNWKKKN